MVFTFCVCMCVCVCARACMCVCVCVRELNFSSTIDIWSCFIFSLSYASVTAELTKCQIGRIQMTKRDMEVH
jgi:hypothetical protein